MADKRWYGLIGLLSLLGFVGVFTGEKYFLGFFARTQQIHQQAEQ